MANPTTMTLALLLLFMVPTNAFPREDNANEPTPTPSESPSSFAALDEVRLVANGLLQLGRNLRNFVQKTKSQINAILHKLTLFNTSFNQLSVLTSKIKEEEKELKKTTVVLKVKNEEIKNLSLEMKSKVKDIMKERIQLWNQVGGIEEKLSGLSQGLLTADQAAEISALKEVIQDQERSISGLLKAVKQQSEHLNDQKNMIKNLENKLNSTRLQETLLKFSGDAKIYSISDYLPHYSTDESFSTDFPRHCGDVFSSGDKSSGLYPIKPNGSEPFLVYCEFTEEGAFTVIQRRHGGSVDFNQSWQSYEDGFGDFKSEFWLGLRKIFSITQQGSALLHIQLENCKQEKHSVEIQYILEGPDSNYTIHLKPGDMTSGLDVPTGLRFSTKDQNDRNRSINPTCINDYSASWWFSICGDVNLNGKCIPSQPRRKGVQGKQNKGQYQLKSTQISIHHRQDSQHSHTNQKK